MSGTFRFAQFSRSCFHPFVNLTLFTCLAMTPCELASYRSPDCPPAFVQFQELLDANQLDQAQQVLDSQSSPKPPWIAESALRLAHALNQMGCPEPARLVLERYWPSIIQSPVQAYGWMLRARLACGTCDFQAWKDFCQAENLLEIQNWPADDRLAFFNLSDRLQSQYDIQLEGGRRLVTSSMKSEAINSYQQLMERLASDLVPRLRLQSLEGIYQLRQFNLQISRLWLELEKAQTALSVLEQWPTLLHENNQQPRFTHQNIERLVLMAQCHILLGQAPLALESSCAAMEQAEMMGRMPLLSLQAALATCEALGTLHQVPQAIDLLEKTKRYIPLCSKMDQPGAQILWLRQKCHLLCEAGQVHQAIEEIDAQIDCIPEGEGQWGVLFIKARLCEQLGQMEAAEKAYFQLLQAGCGSLQAVPASRFLLSRIEQENTSPLVARLSQFLLSPDRPLLDPVTTVTWSRWAIEQQIATREELYKALQKSLYAIQDGELHSTALYLICTIMDEGPQRVLALHQLLKQHQDAQHLNAQQKEAASVTTPLLLLIQGLLIQEEATDSLKAMEELTHLANLAYGASEKSTGDQLMSWSAQRALRSNDARHGALARKQAQEHRDRLNRCDSWKEAYIELSFREIKDGTKSLPQEICQMATQLEQRPTYWGLRCARAHAAALMQVGLTDQACELLINWSQKVLLSEQMEKQAQIEAIDLLHRAGRTAEARTRIEALIARWPELPQRPWLELRRYTWQEYQQNASGSLDNLHSIILKYRNHPASLGAYYLKAEQGAAQNRALNEQLRLWEDVERKSQEMCRTQELPSDAQVLVATASLQRAHCLKSLDLVPQAIGCLRSLLQASAGLCQSIQGSLLEQQARLELARALAETDKAALALEQIKLILKDPYPSPWQAKARLELAALSLKEGDPEACLRELRNLFSNSPLIAAGRSLIAARAYHALHQSERAHIYLDELMALETTDPEIVQLQTEGLWELYQWHKPTNPEKAQQMLIELSRYENFNLGKQAKRLLKSSTYGEKSS